MCVVLLRRRCATSAFQRQSLSTARGGEPESQGLQPLSRNLRGNAARQEEIAAKTGMGSGGSGSGRPKGYGKALASHRGVTAYSNGSGGSTYYERGTYGFEFQCVEYVNRFAVQALGLSNMKGTGNAVDYAGSGRKGLHWVKNEPGDTLPEDGDILVIGGGKFGHVAVCTSGSEGGINIIQQNTSNARGSIGVHKSKGKYSLKTWAGRPVLGWQHPGKPKKVGPNNNSDKADPSTSSNTTKSSDTTKSNETAASSASTSARYKVRRGDTLWDIALKYYGDGAAYTKIAAANHLKNASAIRVGQVLIIPGIKASVKKTKTPKKAPVVEAAQTPVAPVEATQSSTETAATKVEEQPEREAPFEENLGTVTGFSALGQKVGAFFQHRKAGDGEKTEGTLSITLKLAGMIEADVTVKASGQRNGGIWQLKTSWNFKVTRFLFWSLHKKNVGLQFDGSLRIGKKAGEETFKLLSVGLLPKLKTAYPALANTLGAERS